MDDSPYEDEVAGDKGWLSGSDLSDSEEDDRMEQKKEAQSQRDVPPPVEPKPSSEAPTTTQARKRRRVERSHDPATFGIEVRTTMLLCVHTMSMSPLLCNAKGCNYQGTALVSVGRIAHQAIPNAS